MSSQPKPQSMKLTIPISKIALSQQSQRENPKEEKDPSLQTSAVYATGKGIGKIYLILGKETVQT